MRWLHRHSLIMPLALLLLITDHDTAHAYIDPSTGSYVLQIILAGILGTLFTLKLFWKRIRMALSRLITKIRGADSDDG